MLNDAPFFLSHRLPIAMAAQEAGYDVHLAVPYHPTAAERLAREGITVHELPLNRRSSALRGEWQLFRTLCKLYREVRPDIVHHVTIKPVLYGSFARRLTGGGPVVNAVPGLGYLFLARGPKAALRRIIVELLYSVALRGRTSRAIFQNPDDVSLFVKNGMIDLSRVTLIRGSGVDLSHFAYSDPPAAAPLQVVLPARMLRDKGVMEFVTAARSLRAAFPTARFILVGDSDVNRSAVAAEQLRAWQDEGIVEWWGHRTDMVGVLRQAAIVCLPSYREGVPKALLEAAASGRPIVTTDVPGCREVVKNDENGILVPARDSKALAAALGRLLADADCRLRMGRAGRLRAEREFDIREVVRQSLMVYDLLLGARP
ncbi:glycosyltransferase family 4 protein [soil metagenome]